MKNRKDSFSSKTVNLDMGNIAHLDSDKIEAFKRAFINKDWVIGKESKRHGFKADFAHLDFMLAHNNLFAAMPQDKNQWNELMFLEVFYAHLWEYIANVFVSYENVSKNFENVIQENDLVVKKHAELKFKHDIMEDFIATLDDGKRVEFINYFSEAKEAIDAKVAKIIEEDKAQQEMDV